MSIHIRHIVDNGDPSPLLDGTVDLGLITRPESGGWRRVCMRSACVCYVDCARLEKWVSSPADGTDEGSALHNRLDTSCRLGEEAQGRVLGDVIGGFVCDLIHRVMSVVFGAAKLEGRTGAYKFMANLENAPRL